MNKFRISSEGKPEIICDQEKLRKYFSFLSPDSFDLQILAKLSTGKKALKIKGVEIFIEMIG